MTAPRAAGRFAAGAKAVALLAVLSYGAHSTAGLGGKALDGFFEDFVFNAAIVAGALLALVRALTVGRDRWAWLALAGGLACWAAGEILYTVDPATLDGAFPSTSDMLWLAFYPASFVTLVLLVRARVRVFYGSVWLDGVVGALALGAVVLQFVLPPIVAATKQPGADVVADLIYPVGDLLLSVFVVGALALSGWRPGRQLALVAAGVALGAAADCWSLYWSATGHAGATALDVLWPASALVLGWAAWTPAEANREVRLAGRRLLVLPVAFAAVALALLTLNGFERVHGAAYACAVLALAGAVVRMAVTFVENMRLAAASRVEALTDPLTGLANRRSLMEDLEAAAADAAPLRPYRLAVFDLDGFKSYNDTFGHPAGDTLLSALATRLDAAVGDQGTAYRLGGDEFCVLYRPGAASADVAIAAARGALSDRGRGVPITASHGCAELPHEADDVSSALRLADERLYAHKRMRTARSLEVAPNSMLVGREVASL